LPCLTENLHLLQEVENFQIGTWNMTGMFNFARTRNLNYRELAPFSLMLLCQGIRKQTSVSGVAVKSLFSCMAIPELS
jgi:hypothetical protein